MRYTCTWVAGQEADQQWRLWDELMEKPLGNSYWKIVMSVTVGDD